MANSGTFENVEVVRGGFAGAIVEVEWMSAVKSGEVVLMPVTRTGGTLKMSESGKLTSGTLMPVSVLGFSDAQSEMIHHYLYPRRSPSGPSSYPTMSKVDRQF